MKDLTWHVPVVQFDITFPAMPCEWMSLDLMDISGEMHLDVVGLPVHLSICACVHLCSSSFLSGTAGTD